MKYDIWQILAGKLHLNFSDSASFLTLKEDKIPQRYNTSSDLIYNKSKEVILNNLENSKRKVYNIELITIDKDATDYATFQSHNNRTTSNQYGIFITYLHKSSIKNATWHLLRSTDKGKTFQIIHISSMNKLSSAPTIESDEEGNVYVLLNDVFNNTSHFLKFSRANNFRKPLVWKRHHIGGGGKFASAYDPIRRCIYYIASAGGKALYIKRLNLEGDLVHYEARDCKRDTVSNGGGVQMLTVEGKEGYAHYPHLFVTDDGSLFFSWTTTPNHPVYLYRAIFFAWSTSGGKSWHNLKGVPLDSPIVSDISGQATWVSLKSELSNHTWLANSIVLDAKIHFFYQHQDVNDASRFAQQRYVRFDRTTKTKDIDVDRIAGRTIEIINLDGFFVRYKNSSKPHMYIVSRTTDSRIGILFSPDNGTTWCDHARSDVVTSAYSISGNQYVSADGYIMGTFTEDGRKVRFFRVPSLHESACP